MSVQHTSKVETKMRVEASDEGYTVIAHLSEWDLMSAIPGAITRHIVEAIASRFILEHGEVLMKSLLKPEFILTELPKAVESHIRQYYAKREAEKVRRNG